VNDWHPPRLLVLAWQLSADGNSSPALVTEVEVRFIAENANHYARSNWSIRNLQRMGERGARLDDVLFEGRLENGMSRRPPSRHPVG